LTSRIGDAPTHAFMAWPLGDTFWGRSCLKRDEPAQRTAVRRLERQVPRRLGSRRAAASAVRDSAVAVSGATLALDRGVPRAASVASPTSSKKRSHKVHAPEGAGGRARRT
jgi:hypothetical protein